MAVINNLYPPIVDTYMPAFLIKDTGTIYETNYRYWIGQYNKITSNFDLVKPFLPNQQYIDGVQELWDQYESELRIFEEGIYDEITKSYADTTPVIIHNELELRTYYNTLLENLISGLPYEDYIEDNLFVETNAAADRIIYGDEPKTFTIKTTTPTENNKFICRIYFSLSSYNTLEDIKDAQVAIRSQSTNVNVLNVSKYPSGIMLRHVQEDITRKTSDKYYIEIKPEDLEGCNFIIDQYYKVQIRFTKAETEDIPIMLPYYIDGDYEKPPTHYAGEALYNGTCPVMIDGWLYENQNNFSEWSTVCLIRGISVPTLNLNMSSGEITESDANSRWIGELKFADENETETLKSYQIKIYDNTNKTTLLYDTGENFTNSFTNKNCFDYILKYFLSSRENPYLIEFSYTTQNLFSDIEDIILSVQPNEQTEDIQLTITKDEENGRVKLDVLLNEEDYTGQLIIRRTDNKSNFSLWENLYTTNYKNSGLIQFTWYDYTVENGIWYKYAVQSITSEKTSIYIPDVDPIILNFEYIFLISGNKQLKLAYTPTLSSFKHTLSESRIETIGGKYPFIKRNGYIDYVQFPLGGMIYSQMDDSGLFLTPEEKYASNFNLYKNYFNIITTDKKDSIMNDINIYNNEWKNNIWEKHFRDKVIDFLYEDGVKLFKSPTEGNFLIRLMDINFQPNQALGRNIWAFTSNAYEIDDCTVENFKKYNIEKFTDDNIYEGSGSLVESILRPITKIVFVNSENEFPDVPDLSSIYIYEKEIYIYNSENEQYELISVPVWNEIDNNILSNSIGETILYTDGINDLYIWDNQQKEFDKISVPRTNETLLEYEEIGSI